MHGLVVEDGGAAQRCTVKLEAGAHGVLVADRAVEEPCLARGEKQ